MRILTGDLRINIFDVPRGTVDKKLSRIRAARNLLPRNPTITGVIYRHQANISKYWDLKLQSCATCQDFGINSKLRFGVLSEGRMSYRL